MVSGPRGFWAEVSALVDSDTNTLDGQAILIAQIPGVSVSKGALLKVCVSVKESVFLCVCMRAPACVCAYMCVCEIETAIKT